jgi:hypothetical protein
MLGNFEWNWIKDTLSLKLTSFFLDFPIYFLSLEIHSANGVLGREGRSRSALSPLRNKRVKTVCGCREKRVETKEKYKLRLTTKAYKLSYNYSYINCTINPVGRPFGKWRRRRLRSDGSRRVRRMSI